MPIKRARGTFSRELQVRSPHKTVPTDFNIAQVNEALTYVWDYCYVSSGVLPGDGGKVEPFSLLMFMTFNYTGVQMCVLTNNVQVIILCLRSDL